MNAQLTQLRSQNQEAAEAATLVRVQLASASDSEAIAATRQQRQQEKEQAQQAASAAALTPWQRPTAPRQAALGDGRRAASTAALEAAEQCRLAEELLAAAASFHVAPEAAALLAGLADAGSAAAPAANGSAGAAADAASQAAAGAPSSAAELLSAAVDACTSGLQRASSAGGEAASAALPAAVEDASAAGGGGVLCEAAAAAAGEAGMAVPKAAAFLCPFIQREAVQNGFGLPGNPPVRLPKQVRCCWGPRCAADANANAAVLCRWLRRAPTDLPRFPLRVLNPKQVSPTAWALIQEYCSFHAVPGRSDKARAAAAPAARLHCSHHVPWRRPPLTATCSPASLPSPHYPQERRAFDERFIRRDSAALCDLTSAADGLEMRGLVDLGGCWLTGWASGWRAAACPACPAAQFCPLLSTCLTRLLPHPRPHASPSTHAASRAIARLIEGRSAEEIREAFRLPDDLTEEEKLGAIAAPPGGAPAGAGRARLLLLPAC